MARDIQLDLRDDELAFHFETKRGIDAQRLGTFLQRAGRVAHDAGAELRIVGMHEGSLDVVARVTKAVKQRVSAGFAAGGAGGPLTEAFAGRAFARIADMMAPNASGSTPIAKAGADLVEKEGVDKIVLVTPKHKSIVMDSVLAAEIRRIDRERLAEADHFDSALSPFEDAKRLIDAGEEITGVVGEFSGELFFKADRFDFAVPIVMTGKSAGTRMLTGMRYSVRGELVFRDRRPSAFLVTEASAI